MIVYGVSVHQLNTSAERQNFVFELERVDTLAPHGIDERFSVN